MQKQVKCASGLMGWSDKLQNTYLDFEEFESYCESYGLHPTVQGSTNPSDYQKSKGKKI